ncbi:immunoglobulin superfamily containing leucine-rich repeat protein 2-like isoform X2 [Paroedura picta]
MRGALVLRAWLAALAAHLAGPCAACPEPCACVDKYAQQFADCAYKDLEAVPSGLPSNVTTLSLSANRIAALRRGSFADVTQVTSLWLAHNRIAAVEAGTLAPLAQLKNLDVSHNQIADFPWEDLRNLSALQLLKMNNNRMAHLPAGAFRTLRDLRSLRINNNQFRAVAEGTFEPLSSLSHLQLYNNPFDCSCRLMWLKNWTEHTPISIPERDSIRCASPEKLQGVPLARIPYLQCAPPAVRLSSQPDLERTALAYGFSLALHCQATGSPPPELSWEVQRAGQTTEIRRAAAEDGTGNELPAGASAGDPDGWRAFRNGSLLIARLSKKEEGVYTCLAVNEVGRNQSSLHVAVAYPPKEPAAPSGDPKAPPAKAAKNSVMKGEERAKAAAAKPTPRGGGSLLPAGPRNASAVGGPPFRPPHFEQQCGPGEGSRYVSNRAFNGSGDLKAHAFDLGVIALDVSEREAKVQITPRYPPAEKSHLRMLYLCPVGRGRGAGGGGGAPVQWSQVEEGVNAYWFRGLSPGTNYSVCMTYHGEPCQVQVVFATKAEVPSLLIIVGVSVFLLGLATVPLVGATCCHLLSKYQGKTYKLILKAHPQPDPMERRMAADFDPRASYLEEAEREGEEEEEEEGGGGEEEEEEEGGEREAEGSLGLASLPESQSKSNPEEFEVRSQYSDRLPLGAEAVTISEEINGNYKQPAR